MDTTILSLIRHDARSWWYHRDLRQQGKTAEAIKRERQSMRSSVEMLRQPVASYSQRGHSVMFDQRGSGLSSCGNVHDGGWAALAFRHGWKNVECALHIRPA